MKREDFAANLKLKRAAKVQLLPATYVVWIKELWVNTTRSFLCGKAGANTRDCTASNNTFRKTNVSFGFRLLFLSPNETRKQVLSRKRLFGYVSDGSLVLLMAAWGESPQ